LKIHGVPGITKAPAGVLEFGAGVAAPQGEEIGAGAIKQLLVDDPSTSIRNPEPVESHLQIATGVVAPIGTGLIVPAVPGEVLLIEKFALSTIQEKPPINNVTENLNVFFHFIVLPRL